MSEDDENFSTEDNFNYKSITCENIPEIFLDKLVAKHYFGKFGKIKRFILRPKRFSCAVEYESENDAEQAIINAGYFNGENFSVRYTPNEVASRNLDEWVDSEVQGELDAMRPTARLGPIVGANKTIPTTKGPKSILKTRQPVGETFLKVPDNGLRNELETMLRRQALNNEEKYRILEARDKLLRLTNVRTTDIKHVESIKGFCPDMCPEKERLLRENRNQIAIFELEENENRMDHKLAVKEYSRSSADQETPLPHELRSESVLKLTMTYLMYKIIDLCDSTDVNIADWYNFIWDRTRSIRKDITQQELCSPATVELVEQCARFHIHCAARLVAEDSLVFDQKINTENLTKCLQTLKYMYHDLRLQKKKCPNEAEFRSYVILLNLNDSNFLWEVKQLPEEIQNSKHVRFALATYIAMESNNYVRFFKLVREATYMNACILLRYFTQVRIRAIRAIMVAYKWPLHVISISVDYFRDILGFESTEATCLFFEHHGLECDDDKVNLDKKAFFIPEMPFPMERAISLVEGKKMCTAGEAICGRPLDSIEALEKYVPHSSFDDKGYLKVESRNAQDQRKDFDVKKRASMDSDGLFKVPSASPPISPRFKSPSPGLKVAPDFIKTQSFHPIIQPINNATSSIATSTPSPKNDIAKPGAALFSLPVFNKLEKAVPQQSATDSIFGGTSKLQTNKLASFSSAKSNNVEKPVLHTSPLTLNISESKPFNAASFQFNSLPKTPTLTIFNQAIKPAPQFDALSSEDESMGAQSEDEEQEYLQTLKETEEMEREKQRKRELAEERRLQQLREIDTKSEAMLNILLEQELLHLIEDHAKAELTKFRSIICEAEEIGHEIIENTIHEILASIVEEELSIVASHKGLLAKYFSLWRSYVQRELEHRKLMESTPIWISEQSVTEAHPQQAETLKMKERYLLGVAKSFQLRSPEEEYIDVFKIFLDEFQPKVPKLIPGCFLKTRRYFKYVVSLPQEQEELKGFNSYMNSWLHKHITRCGSEGVDEFMCETKENISICLRKVEGISPKNETNQRVTDECDNAHGVIFIMSATNFPSSSKRLHYLLKLSAMCPKIPLAVVVYNPTVEEEFIEEELLLEKLIEDTKIQYYSIFPTTVFKNKNDLREAFEEVFKFLARYTYPSEDYEMQDLTAFLRTTLGEEFWKRLANSALISPSFAKICTQPGKIVTIYNEAIDLLIQMLEENFEELPEFPRELRRFVPAQNTDIPLCLEYFPANWKDRSRNKAIQDFLKDVKLRRMSNLTGDLNEIEQSLLAYCSMSISCAGFAKRAGYGAIKRFLENIEKPSVDEMPLTEKLGVMSWLDVVQPIALELLTCVWNGRCSSLPKEVVYRKSSFKEYTSVPWWFEDVELTSIKMKKDVEEVESPEDIIRPPSAKKSKIDIEALLDRSSALLERADRSIAQYKSITAKSREISRPLDEQLYKQELFNRKLKRCIQSSL